MLSLVFSAYYIMGIPALFVLVEAVLYMFFHFSEDNPQNLTELCCVITTFVLSLKNYLLLFQIVKLFSSPPE